MNDNEDQGMNTSVSELELQLALINKAIFESAIIENKGRYIISDSINSLDNLEVDAIQNQKYISRIISVNASIDFLSNGGNITRCKPVVNKRMKRMYNV